MSNLEGRKANYLQLDIEEIADGACHHVLPHVDGHSWLVRYGELIADFRVLPVREVKPLVVVRWVVGGVSSVAYA